MSVLVHEPVCGRATLAFPLLYFNMASEMIYIIQQRLTAQSVESTRASKVLADITAAVFNASLVKEVFRPHMAINFAILRNIFEKLAHSSIMRLNEPSMSKLFDLMVMVFKYQVFACPKPSDLLAISDNHLQSIEHMIADSESIREIVHDVRDQFKQFYGPIDEISLAQVRCSILNFLKDIHTRVSIFLREGIQASDGRFIINTSNIRAECECQVPGVVRYFGQDQDASSDLVRVEHFDAGGHYYIDEKPTTLGMNIYKKELPASQEDQEETKAERPETHQKEIDLLAKLICKTDLDDPKEQVNEEFHFDFLDNLAVSNSETENRRHSTSSGKIICFDANADHLESNLRSIIDDLNNLQDMNANQDDESSLLDLMDS